MGKEQKFKRSLLSKSFSESEEIAKSEWDIYNLIWASKNDNERCECGTIIENVYVFKNKNKKVDEILKVGSTCVVKYTNINMYKGVIDDFRTVIDPDKDRCLLRPRSLSLFKAIKFISEEEYNFYMIFKHNNTIKEANKLLAERGNDSKIKRIKEIHSKVKMRLKGNNN